MQRVALSPAAAPLLLVWCALATCWALCADVRAHAYRRLIDKDGSAAVDAEAGTDEAGKPVGRRGGPTLLIEAAKAGEVEEVRARLLEGAIEVDAVDKYGCTALQWACAKGHADCIKLLLEADAEKDMGKVATDGLNFIASPVWNCSYGGHAEGLRILLEAGANPRTANEDGETAVFITSSFGHTECLRLLLDAGADKNKPNRNGWTPIWVSSRNGRTDCLKLLFMAGADATIAPHSGWARGRTPLQIATERGHNACAALLDESWGRVDEIHHVLDDLEMAPSSTSIALVIEEGHAMKWASTSATIDVAGCCSDGDPPHGSSEATTAEAALATLRDSSEQEKAALTATFEREKEDALKEIAALEARVEKEKAQVRSEYVQENLKVKVQSAQLQKEKAALEARYEQEKATVRALTAQLAAVGAKDVRRAKNQQALAQAQGAAASGSSGGSTSTADGPGSVPSSSREMRNFVERGSRIITDKVQKTRRPA